MTVEAVVAVGALLGIERLSYIGISRHPRAFARLCATVSSRRLDPTTGVALVFAMSKGIQATVCLWWCWTAGAGEWWPPTGPVPAMVAGGILMATGQILNAAVFQRLGMAGVFYGNRFGRPLPRVTVFPFSWFSHPQYVGALMTVWGFFLVMRFPGPDWFVVPVIETAWYVLGAHVER